MIKRITGLLLALLMLFCAFGALASGAVSGAPRSGEPGEEPVEPTASPEPTDTPEPTDPPKPTFTPEPTNTPEPADPLEILTASLPKGKVGKSYQAQLEANYGDATFKVVGGQFDKTGLKLSSSGAISGKPKNAGTFSFVVEATSASAGTSVRKDFTIEIAPEDTPAPTATTKPTDAPTAAPSSAPTATPANTGIAAPTATPTAAPIATSTPANATSTPANTAGPVQTPAPTAANTPEPTKPASYIAYPLWQRAAETVQQVSVGQPFNIKLIEGISQNLSFSNFYGNLPISVEFVNEVSTTRSCSVKGVLNAEGASEFAVEFTIKGGRKLMLNFRLTAIGADVRPIISFPQGRYLVPFGGTQNAMLPMDDERRRAL